DPETGLCRHDPTAGETCDDGNACTRNDRCNADGHCVGEGSTCDDQNPCTKHWCDSATGECVHESTPGQTCDDGNACTREDTCVQSPLGLIACEGRPVDCDDRDPCTKDFCDPVTGECAHSPAPGEPCDDGSACTRDDTCDADGRCVGQGTACDDQNPCTKDSCDPATGQCVHEPTPGQICDDGNDCTRDDRCVRTELGGVECQGTPVDCNDNDACTTDTCEPAGCVVPDNGEGTATLPPRTCDYASESDLMIVDGLPAGTTIGLSATQRSFICPLSALGCSFSPPHPGVDCDQ